MGLLFSKNEYKAKPQSRIETSCRDRRETGFGHEMKCCVYLLVEFHTSQLLSLMLCVKC